MRASGGIVNFSSLVPKSPICVRGGSDGRRVSLHQACSGLIRQRFLSLSLPPPPSLSLSLSATTRRLDSVDGPACREDPRQLSMGIPDTHGATHCVCTGRKTLLGLLAILREQVRLRLEAGANQVLRTAAMGNQPTRERKVAVAEHQRGCGERKRRGGAAWGSEWRKSPALAPSDPATRSPQTWVARGRIGEMRLKEGARGTDHAVGRSNNTPPCCATGAGGARRRGETRRGKEGERGRRRGGHTISLCNTWSQVSLAHRSRPPPCCAV